MSKRTIFIGDVHGCIDELRELMTELAPTREDRVIFVGDLINKGPASVEVVQYVYERGYECVLGNHELSYIKYHEVKPKYQKYRSQISLEIHNWLLNLPYYIEGENFITVHGGVVPGFHPRETDKEIIVEIRYWDVKNNKIGGLDDAPWIPGSNDVTWYDLYTGLKRIIYGHWATQRLMIRENTIGLDSGCVYGGELSAYVFETGDIIKVKARKIYQET